MPDEKKHTYESTTLGLPPLRMVLVHGQDREEQPQSEVAPSDRPAAQQDKEKAVRRIIDHLNKKP